MIEFKNKTLLPKKIKVALHHSAISRNINPLQAQAIRDYHGQKWNFPSELNGSAAGYNFIGEPTGFVTQERYIGEETIAQIGHNCDTISRCDVVSYCMPGDFRVEQPTLFQKNSFVSFVRELESHGFEVEITRHTDLQPGRTCPVIPLNEINSWFDIDDEVEKLQKIIELQGTIITLLLARLNK